MRVDLGTVPAWVSAFATFSGVVWGLCLFTINSERERAKNPNLVAVWPSPVNAEIHIKNCGTAPISDISVFVIHDGQMHELVATPPALNPDATAVVAWELDGDVVHSDAITVEFKDPECWTWQKPAAGPAKRLGRYRMGRRRK